MGHATFHSVLRASIIDYSVWTLNPQRLNVHSVQSIHGLYRRDLGANHVYAMPVTRVLMAVRAARATWENTRLPPDRRIAPSAKRTATLRKTLPP